VLYRRICLLRTRGHSLEAARLQSTELSRAVTAVRQSAGSAADCDAKSSALFSLEEERITNANVLAEILLPLLREFAPAEVPRAAAARSSPSPVSAAEPKPVARTPTTPLGIADFIDEMLQQERAASRPTAP